MRNLWTGVFAASLLGAALLTVASAEKPATGDLLDKLPALPWEWIRQHPAGWRVKDGALELQALPGTLWDKQNDARNLLVRPLPFAVGDALTVEVTLHFAPQSQAEQAGLMIYFDDDNYVKVVREWLDGKRLIVMGAEKNGQGKAVAKVPAAADTLTLRMTCRGGQVIAEYRAADGDAWSEVGRCDLPAGSGLKLGVAAYGGSGEQTRWARFSSFAISRAAAE